MPQRMQFQPKSHLEDLIAVQNSNRKLNVTTKDTRKQFSLSEAGDLIYEQLMARSEKDVRLYQDITMAGLGEPGAQARMTAIIENLLTEFHVEIDPLTLMDNMTAAECVFAQSCGAGLLEDIYRGNIEEVSVSDQDIFIMEKAKQRKINRSFDSIEEVKKLQNRLALCGKKSISEKNPVIQTYMWNGSRLTMTMPPYTAEHTIAIRNFPVFDVTLRQLAEPEFQTLSEEMAYFLELVIRFHLSVIVSGGTNVGKTTLLFALCQEFMEDEKIITLEKEFELQLRKRLKGVRHYVSAREVLDLGLTMELAFQPLLIMSPNRIIVGEAKGAEISQVLQASRAHEVYATIHVENRRSLFTEMIDMAKQDGRDHNFEDDMRRIARGIQIVLFLRRVSINGIIYRKIVEITVLYINEHKEPVIEPIYVWDYEEQMWKKTGHKLPKDIMERMVSHGANPAVFKKLGVY